MQNQIHKQNRGFTLIEIVVGLAIFLIVALATYGAFVAIFQLAAANQARTLAVALATEQFETIRNMPYSNVGIVSGIPRGTLPDMRTLVRGGIPFVINLAIRNVNLSTSTVQASSKLVEVEVLCPTCKNYTPVTLSGLVAPANLQSAANGGALVVQVFDSKGQPVQGAQVHVVNIATTTSIVVDDERKKTTDGTWSDARHTPYPANYLKQTPWTRIGGHRALPVVERPLGMAGQPSSAQAARSSAAVAFAQHKGEL
jgi:prepilin-type N-terminal cleavage/methylation domain-containing protein